MLRSPLGRGLPAHEGARIHCPQVISLVKGHLYHPGRCYHNFSAHPTHGERWTHTLRSLTPLVSLSDAQGRLMVVTRQFILFSFFFFYYFASQFILRYGWTGTSSKSPSVLLRKCCGKKNRHCGYPPHSPSAETQMTCVGKPASRCCLPCWPVL